MFFVANFRTKKKRWIKERVEKKCARESVSRQRGCNVAGRRMCRVCVISIDHEIHLVISRGDTSRDCWNFLPRRPWSFLFARSSKVGENNSLNDRGNKRTQTETERFRFRSALNPVSRRILSKSALFQTHDAQRRMSIALIFTWMNDFPSCGVIDVRRAWCLIRTVTLVGQLIFLFLFIIRRDYSEFWKRDFIWHETGASIFIRTQRLFCVEEYIPYKAARTTAVINWKSIK